MPIETLTINGDGTTTSGWTAEGGTFASIQSDDGDTSRLYSPVANHVRQFSVTNPSSLSGATINSVNVYFKFRSLDPVSNTFQIGVRAGGTDYWSANKDTVNVTTYVLFSETWTTNPNTSSAWTVSEINALEIGVKKTNTVGGAVTYGYVEVDYTTGGANHTITINESLSLSDGITKSIQKPISDTLSLDTDVSAVKSITSGINDDITINDSISKAVSKSLSESLNIDDQVNPIVSQNLSLADITNVEDSISKEIQKVINETLSLDTDVTAVKSITSGINDDITINDSISKAVSKSLSESLNIDDQVNPIVSQNLSLADITNVEDSISKEIQKVINETLSLDTDVTTRITKISRSVKGYSMVSKIVTGRKYKKM